MERLKNITIIFLLVAVLPASGAGAKSASVLLQEGLYAEEIEGNLDAAIKVYERIVKEFPKNRPVAAKALLHIGLCYEKLGKQEAQKAYQRLIKEFADQKALIAKARSRLSALEKPATRAEPKGMTVRKVWEGSDVDNCGEISPDGNYLSYVDWDTGDLAVYEIATGKKRRLTNKGSWEESDEFAEFSRWSPDSKQIAYTWYNEQYNSELSLIGINDAAEPRILFSEEDYRWITPCDWSKDGEFILAWLKRQNGGQVAVISILDGSVRVLKEFDKGRFNNMVFSPEGDNIVYDDPDGDIFMLSLENGKERALVKHPANDSVLGWGRDGKYLLFASDRSGMPDIWAVGVDGGKAIGGPQLVKSGMGVDPPRGLGTTTEGLFYYSHFPKQTDVYVTELDPETGDVVSPPHEAISQFVGSNATPDYSPDGKYMAYISKRAPFFTRAPFGNVLVIRSLETGEERSFRPPDLDAFGFPRWSPDGRSLMVIGLGGISIRTENWEMGLYIINAETGKADLIVKTKRPQRMHDHAWGADEKSFVFVRSTMPEDGTGDMRMEIVNREVAGGKETTLLSGTLEDIYTISRSPDGRRLAILGKKKKRNLRVISLTGGEPRVVHTFEQGNRTIHHTWSADSRYILMPKVSEPKDNWREWDICRISVEDGKTQNLGLEMRGFQWLSAHPDGRHIAFGSRAANYKLPAVWVMENFLPGDKENKVAQKPAFQKVHIPNTISWDAQLSPDGKSILFVNDQKLWIMPRSGRLGPGFAGEPRLLDTAGVEADWCGFTWSGDGQWIAFNGKEVEKGRQQIYVVSADGGKPRQVHENNRDARVVNYRMSLSPNGKTLTFTQVDANELHVYTLDVEGGSPKRLVETRAREPVFSPDGNMIAYVEDKALGRAGGGLWVVPADGGKPKLVADADNASTPVWSPNGKMIAFVDYDSSDRIYVVPLTRHGDHAGEKMTIVCPKNTSGVRRLTGWTPDNKIGAIFETPTEFALYTQPIDGGKASFVAHGGYPTQPRWSPEGKRIFHVNNTNQSSGDWQGHAIAYVSARRGRVTTVPLHSEHKIRLQGIGTGNHISPDGKTIVFAGHKAKQPIKTMHIWTLPVEGGTPKQLTDAPAPYRDWYPCWSPDGQKIAFVRMKASDNWAEVGNADIYVIPRTGGQARKLTSQSDGVFSFGPVMWSPDGELLAYFSRDRRNTSGGKIKVIPAKGGESQNIVEVQKITANKEMAWSPDGKRIAYNAPENKIKIVSIKDGSIEEIEPDLKVEGIYHLDWSPNGKKFVFAGCAGGGPEFWMIEDFLPELDDSE